MYISSNPYMRGHDYTHIPPSLPNGTFPWWAPGDLKWCDNFPWWWKHQTLKGVSSGVKEPSPGGSPGALWVCEYLTGVKMNQAVHELHSPQAWTSSSEQPLSCCWGQNIMLDRGISVLVLSPRNSKISPARLTLVAKALPFGREEAFLFPEGLWVLWGREQNE